MGTRAERGIPVPSTKPRVRARRRWEARIVRRRCERRSVGAVGVRGAGARRRVVKCGFAGVGCCWGLWAVGVSHGLGGGEEVGGGAVGCV